MKFSYDLNFRHSRFIPYLFTIHRQGLLHFTPHGIHFNHDSQNTIHRGQKNRITASRKYPCPSPQYKGKCIWYKSYLNPRKENINYELNKKKSNTKSWVVTSRRHAQRIKLILTLCTKPEILVDSIISIGRLFHSLIIQAVKSYCSLRFSQADSLFCCWYDTLYW